MGKIIKFHGDFFDIHPTADFKRIYKISRDERNNPVLYIFDDEIKGGYGGEYFSEDFQEREKKDFNNYVGLTIRNLYDALIYAIFAASEKTKYLEFIDHILDYETLFSAPDINYIKELYAAIYYKSTPEIEKLKVKIFNRMQQYKRAKENTKANECRKFLNDLFQIK